MERSGAINKNTMNICHAKNIIKAQQLCCALQK